MQAPPLGEPRSRSVVIKLAPIGIRALSVAGCVLIRKVRAILAFCSRLQDEAPAVRLVYAAGDPVTLVGKGDNGEVLRPVVAR